MRTAIIKGSLRLLLIAALIGSVWCGRGHATGLFSSVDTEKPNPEFTQDGDRITAQYIPRAKSTSVSVEFQVTDGGTIDQVKGIDFFAIDRPEVDIKNFKSAAFEIGIRDIAPGGKATVAIRSDFFSLSTAFFIFNPHLAAPWIRDAQKENRLLADRVRELVVEVQDGSDRDADGAADGRITMVGGPRDSFWGYALGTLFIRFFGIFFVLTLLMAGMIVSGRVFTLLDRLKGIKPAAPTPAPVAAMPPAGKTPGKAAVVPEAVVAAIGAALYLGNRAGRIAPAAGGTSEPGRAWSAAGRQRIMQERLALFRSVGRKADR